MSSRLHLNYLENHCAEMLPVLALILCIVYIYIKSIKPTWYWKLKQIPHEKSWPIIGSMGPVIFRRQHLCHLIQYWYNKNIHRRYYGINQFSVPTLVIQDPQLIEEICVKHFDSFTDHHDFLPRSSDWFWSKNLYCMNGQKWKNMRAVLSPVFRSTKVKLMFELMVECAQNVVDHYELIDDVVTVDIKDLFRRYSNDVIASTAYGVQLNSFKNPNNEFFKCGTKVFDMEGIRGLKFFGEALSPTLMKILRIKILDDRTKNLFMQKIRETIAFRESTGMIRCDMIHILREAQKGILNDEDEIDDGANYHYSAVTESHIGKNKSVDRQTITDLDIAAHATLFFFGGFETVSVVMSHIAYELALNPEIQNKLISEVDETLKKCHGRVTYKSILEMRYFDMVTSETLRIWGPSTINIRKATKSFTIKPKLNNEIPLTIDVDTAIWIPVYALHHDKRYFKNPEIFDPERFAEERKQNIRAFTYMPFGTGPRNCIASCYALLKVKTIIFFLLSKYEIVPVKKTQIPFMLSKKTVVVNNDVGYWLGIKRRK